jgi:antitoxin VapB
LPEGTYLDTLDKWRAAGYLGAEVEVSKKYRATLFTNGGSQAVRLPKECRFDGKVVEVWKEGSRVILAPVEKRDWSPGFWERMMQLAPEVSIEVPERLPDSPYREAVIDELAKD